MENTNYEKAKASYKAQRYEDAVLEFSRALTSDPGNAYILYERALAYFHLNQKNMALVDLNLAAEMQPNNPFRYSSRAYVRDACGDVVGAIEDYKMAIALDPLDAIAHNNLGLLEEKLGRKQNAQKYFQIADDLSGKKNEFKPYFEMQEEADAKKQSLATETQQSSSLWKEITKIFTTKNQFAEFIAFVKRGFK